MTRKLYVRSVWVARDEDFSRVDRISLGGTHTVYGSRSRRWDAGIIILNLWGGLFVLICRFFTNQCELAQTKDLKGGDQEREQGATNG